MTFDEVLESYRPRIAIEEKYNASPGGSVTGKRDIYVIAERLAAGTQTVNTVNTTAYADADEAVAAFGEGSFGAYQLRQVFRTPNLKSKVFGIPVAESGGVAATQIVSFNGDATSNGTYTFNIAGAVLSFSVESGDGETDIATAMTNAFDQLGVDVKPPCTVAAAIDGAGPAYKATFTMTNKGAHGNTAPCYQIVKGNEPATTAVTVNGVVFGLDTGALGAVTGTLYPTLTTALANIAAVQTPIVVHAFDETPDGSTKPSDVIRDHLITKCNAENMTRGTMVTAITKTVAVCVSDVAALDTDDAERCRVACQPVDTATNSPGNWHVAMTSWVAGAIATRTDLAAPFNGTAIKFAVQAPDSGDILTNAELDTLIEGGCTPLNYSREKGAYVIVKGVGARLFNSKPQSWAVVDVTDELRYQYLVALAAAFPDGTKLAEDGETNLDERTATPKGVLDVLHDVYFGPTMRGLIRNRETLWAEAAAEINGSNENRVDWDVPHAAMNGLDVIAGKMRQRGGIIG